MQSLLANWSNTGTNSFSYNLPGWTNQSDLSYPCFDNAWLGVTCNYNGPYYGNYSDSSTKYFIVSVGYMYGHTLSSIKYVIKFWADRSCHFLDHNIWQNLSVTRMYLSNMNFLIIFESATPQLNVMEWSLTVMVSVSPGSLCGAHLTPYPTEWAGAWPFHSMLPPHEWILSIFQACSLLKLPTIKFSVVLLLELFSTNSPWMPSLLLQ